MRTLEIWNMALGFIGTRTVASETERTPEAIQCGLYYDSARQTALRDYPWQFAQSRVQMAQQPLPEVWAGVWKFAYALPVRCLKARKVVEQGSTRPHPFEIVKADGVTLLLTDVDKAMLDYTEDVTDAALFDSDFGAALARKLASLICVPLLKNNSGKVQELVQLYAASLPAAHDSSSTEQKAKPEEDSWLTARAW